MLPNNFPVSSKKPKPKRLLMIAFLLLVFVQGKEFAAIEVLILPLPKLNGLADLAILAIWLVFRLFPLINLKLLATNLYKHLLNLR